MKGMNVMFGLSMQVMLYGLVGVFSALAILALSVKALTKIFPNK